MRRISYTQVDMQYTTIYDCIIMCDLCNVPLQNVKPYPVKWTYTVFSVVKYTSMWLYAPIPEQNYYSYMLMYMHS